MIFGRFAGAEKTYGSPLQLVGDALSDPNPIRAFRSLTQPVIDAPDEFKEAAKAGLLSSVLEHVIGTQAGAEGAKVNFTKAYQTLFAPLPGAGRLKELPQNLLDGWARLSQTDQRRLFRGTKFLREPPLV